MDAFDVWSEDNAAGNLAPDAPATASNTYNWEDDLVPRGGGSRMGHAFFRGTKNGQTIDCKGWIEIDGDSGGSVLLQGKLTLVNNEVGEGRLKAIAVSTTSRWQHVDVSIENPKRYKTV